MLDNLLVKKVKIVSETNLLVLMISKLVFNTNFVKTRIIFLSTDFRFVKSKSFVLKLH